ncbi:hypothetical protein SLEP1_g55406 [Rubroshorea leprosula]|uniref:Uncharacterized protein n=1 Tax=Rubroshorea leprosula TaxID=152421 RepID=A0AAV5MHU2_9ROSI|nr:hypothetical protein SLEP1_g55406 [Rubroshorea leprosula]
MIVDDGWCRVQVIWCRARELMQSKAGAGSKAGRRG